MHIKNIHLKNYRGIEDLTVEFGSGMNLIIGNNGAGKSSLLEGISVALGSLFSLTHGIGSKEITKDEIRIVSTLVGSVTESVEYCVPVSVDYKLEFGGIDYEDICKKENEASPTKQDNYNASDKMNEILNDKASLLPLLSYQSDEIQFFSAVNHVNRPSGPVERRQGYKGCLTGIASVAEMQDWCAQMDYAGYRLGHEAVEYVLFKHIVSSFVSKLENKDVRVEFSPKLNRLAYSESY